MAQATFTAPIATGAVVSVERITPEAAQRYLDNNLPCNRKLMPTNVDKFAAQMRASEWKLSTDAIGFDVEGYLVNGQHRMSAVAKTGISQEFIVVRNLPTKNTKVLDLGRRRMIHDRLAIDGVNISERECAFLRNAMGEFTSNNLGTTRFNDLRKDGIVKETWLQHEDFIHFVYKRYRNSLSTLIEAAGLKAYVWLVNYPSAWEALEMKGLIPEGQTRLGRVIQFLDIVATGYSKDWPTRAEDCAAVNLHQMLLDARARGKRLSSMEHYRVVITYLRAFIYAQPKKAAIAAKSDPFVKEIQLFAKGTQEAFAEDFINEPSIVIKA